MTTFIPSILALIAGLPLIGTITQWAALVVAKVRVNKVSVFQGPAIASFGLFGTTVAIGCIPTGSSVSFDLPSFGGRSLWVRLAVSLSGPVAILGVAVLCVGGSRALGHFASGFSQLAVGALHPLSHAPILIGRLHEVFRQSVPAAAGIVAAKLAAFAFLPVGGMTATECLRQLLDPRGERPYVVMFVTISAIAAILMAMLWLVALATYAACGNA